MTGCPPLAAIVLAAGKGTRMRSPRPKVLHAIANRPMLAHVLDALAPLNPQREVVVLAPGMDVVAKFVAPRPIVVQDPPLGTGHAVMAARAALDGFAGDVLILYADTPLITTATLRRLQTALHEPVEAAIAVLAFRPDQPAEYGRVVLDDDGVAAVVEYRDADERTRALALCNAGVMAVAGDRLLPLLERLGNGNAKGEYYLTDLVALARKPRAGAWRSPRPRRASCGASTRRPNWPRRRPRCRRACAGDWLDAGVTMAAPRDRVPLRADTRLAPDVDDRAASWCSAPA